MNDRVTDRELHDDWFKISKTFDKDISIKKIDLLVKNFDENSFQDKVHTSSNGQCHFGQSLQLKHFPDEVIPVHESPQKIIYDRL